MRDLPVRIFDFCALSVAIRARSVSSLCFLTRRLTGVSRIGGEKLHTRGPRLLYQPAPQPIVYIIPVTDILGRLALVPYGELGTIPYDWCNLARFYPRGECDGQNSPGSGVI